MGMIRVARVTAQKTSRAGNPGKKPVTIEYDRELTPFEEKYAGWIVGIFVGVFVVAFIIALIFS